MSTTDQQRAVYQIRKYTVGQKCRNMLKGCRDRARKNNVYFDITIEELNAMWPEDGLCPVFGITLALDNPTIADDSPSLDRFNNDVGYTRDNCTIISMKANRMKSNATVAEMQLLVNWMGEQ